MTKLIVTNLYLETSTAPLLLPEGDQEHCHSSLCSPRRPGLFTTSGPGAVRVKAFQWGCLSLPCLSSCPFLILLARRLYAWFSQRFGEITGAPVHAEDPKKGSPRPLRVPEAPGHKGSHSSMLKRFAEAAIGSAGKQRSVWTVSTTLRSTNISFPVHRKQRALVGLPQTQRHSGTSMGHRMPLSSCHHSVGPEGFPRSYFCLLTAEFGPPRNHL